MNTHRYFTMAVATLALVACNNKELDTTPTDTTANGTSTTGVTSQIMSNLDILSEENVDGTTLATRGTLAEGQFASWTVGDEISITDGTLMYKYKVTQADGTHCDFNLIDPNATPITGANAAGKTFYAAYPAAAVKGWNGSTVTSMVYAEQDYTENADEGAMGAYMVAQATANEDGQSVLFAFTHTSSVIEIGLSDLGVTPKAVYVKSNSGVSLAGQVKCNAANKNLTIDNSGSTTYATSSMSDVVGVINIPENATTARLYVLPVELKGGVTVTVVDTDNNYYTKSTTGDLGTTTNAGFDITNNMSKEAEQNAIPTHTPCKPYYKKLNFGATSAANTRKGNWMATIPGNIHWNMVSTPGAHDAATAGITSALLKSSSMCQDLTIQQLLDAGVRQFDIRPGYMYTSTITKDNLYIYHGQANTNVKYVDAMSTLASFVKNNPTEAISVIMVKENNKPILGGSSYTDRSSEMWSVINTCHSKYNDCMKHLNHSYYTLADFRGKICYINRTGTDCTNTIRITNWPDNSTVSDWSCGMNICRANVQDKYNTNGTAKQDAVKEMLGLSSANTEGKNFTYNYTSSANLPSNYASATNPVIAAYLNEGNITGPTGYVLADFIGCTKNSGKTLLDAIVNQNYRYVFNGRTRKQ